MNFKQLNKLSHALWGVGTLIEDVYVPNTRFQMFRREMENRQSELIAHMGKRIEVNYV